MNSHRFCAVSSLFASIVAASFLIGCDPKQPEPAPQVPAQPATNTPVATNSPSTQLSDSAVAPASISAKEAKNHVGEVATVKGKIFRVYQSKKGDVFIDVDGKYPDAPFTVVCFKEAVPTQELKKLEGKVVSFNGKIKEFNGRVEIILDSADQITEE